MNTLRRVTILFIALAASLLLSGCFFTQYIAHYANLAGWKTLIKIMNPHGQAVDVHIVCRNDDGTEAAAADISIPARGFYRADIENVFATPIPATGSLFITANEPSATPKVTSVLMFEYEGGPALAGLQSFQSPQKAVHIPWYNNSDEEKTGLGILNVNPYTIQAVIWAKSASGTVTRSNTIELDPYARKVGFPVDFFPPRTLVPADACVSIYASGKVAGFVVTYDTAITKSEAVNGIPQIPARVEAGALQTVVNLNALATRMLFSPDGTVAYIRTESPYTLTVMNMTDHSIIGTYPTTSYGDAALSADAKTVYFSDRTDDAIYAMNTSSYTVSKIADYESPTNLSVSNDGHWLLVTNSTGWKAFNLDGLRPRSQSGFTNIQDAVFSEDSKFIYVADFTEKKLTSFELATSEIKEINVADSPRCLLQLPGTSHLYAAGNGSRVYQIALPGFSLTSTMINAGSTVYRLAASPDGRLLYIPCVGDQHLWLYDTLTGELKDWKALGASVICIAVTPEGDRVYFVQNTGSYSLRYFY